nr:SPFH domain-containing protein [Bathymodiolus platifrons methanotrophic gill symbiont]
MALFDGIRRQLRTVIQWETPEEGILFQQWQGNGDELKNASKLLVGPGQGCIFVYEGRVKAVLNETGLVNLKTDNIPFWTTVTRFMQFFESEHKAHIYFYRRTKILDQKWGRIHLLSTMIQNISFLSLCLRLVIIAIVLTTLKHFLLMLSVLEMIFT